MNGTVARGLRAVAVRRAVPTQAVACRSQQLLGLRRASSLPTLLQPSFWKAIVPKPLRRSPEAQAVESVVKVAATPWWSREWNPATFYIAIFLCIGSMSIQMISLKKGFDGFMRQSEVKIGLLREVLERVQKGEDVDVERVLGTDDPSQEAGWEAALREIERDDVSKRQQNKKAASKEPVINAAPEPIAIVPPTKGASITSFY
ncbi:hypothetical protein CMQ_3633 [Grosmannia clavigera kw1407]|uniref:Uncharacterized protein n=1 Tax=Grosmannia clavigera (strain kw1407 / UAMH 11150) TaxID=655863 RepID=F0XAD8_GROCL|nr:uncharacterized protein CMQ_3633 [Grosmannia clavigera kw1407]EFX05564.1 hypothetical protein CMQ_3633 [Grosmannia clavigera kw1407]